MSKVNVSDKIISLQKHLERVKNMAQSPNSKYTGVKLETWKEWVKLEVKRTEAKIMKLRG